MLVQLNLYMRQQVSSSPSSNKAATAGSPDATKAPRRHQAWGDQQQTASGDDSTRSSLSRMSSLTRKSAVDLSQGLYVPTRKLLA
eukprot:scaffold145641_cov18-Prasinocladus_malaysianus.AAC.1